MKPHQGPVALFQAPAGRGSPDCTCTAVVVGGTLCIRHGFGVSGSSACRSRAQTCSWCGVSCGWASVAVLVATFAATLEGPLVAALATAAAMGAAGWL